MKILICDDEQLARERLIRLLADIPSCDVVAQVGLGSEVLAQVKKYQPDVVLLDIQMPGLNGLQVALQLTQLEHPPAIIFCTAYEEYAVAAFRAQAVGYLLKPVRQAELQRALLQAQQLNRMQLKLLQQLASSQQAAPSESLAPEERTHLSVRTHRGIELIPIQDVRLIRADQKYSVLKTFKQEFLLDDTLKELEALFPQTLIRVHRNALVLLSAVESLKFVKAGHYVVVLQGCADEVPVSRRYLSQVKQKIQHRG